MGTYMLCLLLVWLASPLLLLVLGIYGIRRHQCRQSVSLVREVEEFLQLEGTWRLPSLNPHH